MIAVVIAAVAVVAAVVVAAQNSSTWNLCRSARVSIARFDWGTLNARFDWGMLNARFDWGILHLTGTAASHSSACHASPSTGRLSLVPCRVVTEGSDVQPGRRKRVSEGGLIGLRAREGERVGEGGIYCTSARI